MLSLLAQAFSPATQPPLPPVAAVVVLALDLALAFGFALALALAFALTLAGEQRINPALLVVRGVSWLATNLA